MEKVLEWKFNIAIDDKPETMISMDNLMNSFAAYEDSDPEKARSVLEEAYKCAHLPAKFKYAKYLIHTPQLTMSQEKRYAAAEKMLLELINLLDMSNEFVSTVAMELAHLYSDYLDRPVGALGYLLIAKQHGAKISDDELKRLQRKLSRTDVNCIGVNDAYILGTGLLREDGAFRMTEFLLREAVDQSALNPEMAELHGRACLSLADLYNAHQNESKCYLEESRRLYQEAQKYNYPEYIRKPKKRSRPYSGIPEQFE